MARTTAYDADLTPSNLRGSMGYVYLLAFVAALGGLLFGYDTAVISGTIGYLSEYFNLGASLEKGWAAASVLLGCAAGAAFAGFLSDRLGRKKMLAIAGLFFLASALGTALPQSLGLFVVFRVLGGLAIGAASISSPMYIAEISPARMRGMMVSLNQFAIVFGILGAYCINYLIAAHGMAQDRAVVADYIAQHGAAVNAETVRPFVEKQLVPKAIGEIRNQQIQAIRQGSEITANLESLESGAQELAQKWSGEFLNHSSATLDSAAVAKFLKDRGVSAESTSVNLVNQGETAWNVRLGWRWMFGFGALPAVIFLGLLLLVPESPRWLTKQGRPGEAETILARVNGRDVAKAEMATIERAIAEESGSLSQLFQPGMRVALVIGVVLAVLQQVTGINVFLYFAPEIFKKMGSGDNAALLQTVLVGGVNLAFTVIAIRTVDWLGRKPLMLIGSAGMGLTLLGMAAAAYWERTDVWVLAFILGYIACFALSIGPVTWVILAEIFPTSIRGRAMALATVCLWLADFVVTQTFPMMDENPWLVATFHRAFPFLLYAVLCAVSVGFVWQFVPETKGKTLEEIERSWTR